MNHERPLGEYEPLLSSSPQEWGPGVAPSRRGWSGSDRYHQPTTVIHGSNVVDDLIAGIQHFRQSGPTGYWSRLSPSTAAIGCVPWMTDLDVISELALLESVCIVVDKQHYGPRAAQLHRRGRPLSSAYLDGFEELALPDATGSGPVIDPHSSVGGPGLVDPIALGPVRVAGWATDQGQHLPLLHSKMLVLGVTTYYEDDEMFAGDILRFNPLVTWMGSANWTQAARRHVEHGLWSTDPALVSGNYDYLCSLIEFSEDVDAALPQPTPPFVSATWDDQAFREYFAEYHLHEVESADEVKFEVEPRGLQD